MAITFGNAIGGGVDRLVRWLILPVTGIIPVMLRTGLLFLAFAALWLGFFVALLVDPVLLDSARQAIDGLPLLAQVVAWLLFLPLMLGFWIWSTDWALAVRIALVVGIAGWNLVVFVPRRETTTPVASN